MPHASYECSIKSHVVRTGRGKKKRRFPRSPNREEGSPGSSLCCLSPCYCSECHRGPGVREWRRERKKQRKGIGDLPHFRSVNCTSSQNERELLVIHTWCSFPNWGLPQIPPGGVEGQRETHCWFGGAWNSDSPPHPTCHHHVQVLQLHSVGGAGRDAYTSFHLELAPCLSV